MFTLTADVMKYPYEGIQNVIKVSNINNYNGINMIYDFMENVNNATDAEFQSLPNIESTLTNNINNSSISYENLASHDDDCHNSFHNQPVQNFISTEQHEQAVISIVPEFSYPNINFMPTVPINDYALIPYYYLVVPKDSLVTSLIIPVSTIPEQVSISLENPNNYVGVIMGNTSNMQEPVNNFPNSKKPTAESKDDSVIPESSLNVKANTSEISYLNSERQTIEKYECKACNRKFDNLNQFEIHKGIHIGDKLFFCPVCHLQFNYFQGFKLHMRLHNSNKEYSCDVCKEKFKWAEFLEQHKKRCKNVKTMDQTCSLCEKTFINNIALERHMINHKKRHLCECDLCGKIYTHPRSLKGHHMRVHSSEEFFKCKECHKKFRTRFDLNHHMFVHTGEVPLECDLCKEKFVKNKHLIRHIRAHEKQRICHCDICGAIFSSPGSVLAHKIKYHAWQSSKCLKCKFCNESFTDKYSFKLHRDNHKNGIYWCCNICLYQTKWHMSLKLHVQNHSKPDVFICDDCGSTKKTKDFLLKHIQKCHNP